MFVRACWVESHSLPGMLISILEYQMLIVLFPVDAQSKAWVCARSLAGIVCSNPTGGMDVCLL